MQKPNLSDSFVFSTSIVGTIIQIIILLEHLLCLLEQ